MNQSSVKPKSKRIKRSTIFSISLLAKSHTVLWRHPILSQMKSYQMKSFDMMRNPLLELEFNSEFQSEFQSNFLRQQFFFFSGTLRGATIFLLDRHSSSSLTLHLFSPKILDFLLLSHFLTASLTLLKP